MFRGLLLVAQAAIALFSDRYHLTGLKSIRFAQDTVYTRFRCAQQLSSRCCLPVTTPVHRIECAPRDAGIQSFRTIRSILLRRFRRTCHSCAGSLRKAQVRSCLGAAAFDQQCLARYSPILVAVTGFEPVSLASPMTSHTNLGAASHTHSPLNRIMADSLAARPLPFPVSRSA